MVRRKRIYVTVEGKETVYPPYKYDFFRRRPKCPHCVRHNEGRGYIKMTPIIYNNYDSGNKRVVRIGYFCRNCKSCFMNKNYKVYMCKITGEG